MTYGQKLIQKRKEKKRKGTKKEGRREDRKRKEKKVRKSLKSGFVCNVHIDER